MGFSVFVGVRGMNLEGVGEQVRLYKAAWDEAGHSGDIDVSLRVPVYVGATKEDALRTPEESFMRQFRRLGGQLAASAGRAGADPREERAERSQQLASLDWERDVIGQKAAVGTPEAVVEQTQRDERSAQPQRRGGRAQRRRAHPRRENRQLAAPILRKGSPGVQIGASRRPRSRMRQPRPHTHNREPCRRYAAAQVTHLNLKMIYYAHRR